MKISVVVPAYNEAAGIESFNQLLIEVLRKIQKTRSLDYEVVYIDDGSTDHTIDILKSLAAKDKSIKALRLTRNFGKELATTAGIEQAEGDAVIMLDSDGQHPPEKIDEFITKWQAGAKVVVGVRDINKHEGPIKKYGSRLFYRLFNAASGTKLLPNSTDFCLLDKAVRREFLRFSEHRRITRGLIGWLGFETAVVKFGTRDRLAGAPTYKARALVRLALNSFVSLSLKPLVFVGWLGLMVTLFALILGAFIVVEHLLLGDPLGLNITGTAMLGVFISFLSGIILSSQGILAIYLSHIHERSQNRPLFVVDYSNSVGIHESTF